MARILQKRLWNVPNPFNNTRCRFANDEWVAWKHDINDLDKILRQPSKIPAQMCGCEFELTPNICENQHGNHEKHCGKFNTILTTLRRHMREFQAIGFPLAPSSPFLNFNLLD